MTDAPLKQRSSTVLAWLGLTCALFSMTVLSGCADHRIPLEQFLAMQAESGKAEIVEANTAAAVEASVDRQLGPHRVGPSDILEVIVTSADEAGQLPPMQARVNRNGQIDLPLVGPVAVADLELEDVEAAIKAAYVPDVLRGAAVHVGLLAGQVTNVLVVGAATNPGLVRLRRTERDLLHAIVAAGGVTEAASGKATLRRVRRPGEEVTLDLTDPQQLQAALALDPLDDGDIVSVQAATPNMLFVGGLVNLPRAQMYPQGVQMTVLQAIAAAGGLRTDITPREATLIRRLDDGQDVHVRLNLDNISTGADPNIVLAAGDILWVPFTIETRVQDFINRNIFLRAGVSVNYSVSGIEFMNRQDQQAGDISGGGLQDAFDPFGFLGRGSGIQTLVNQPPPQ